MSGRTIGQLNRKKILTNTVGIGCKPSADKYVTLTKRKTMDYTAIKQGIDEARKESKAALGKVKDLKKTKDEISRKKLDDIHFENWSCTAKQLMRELTRIELELEQFYFIILEKDLEIFKPLVQDVKFYERELEEDFDGFIIGIVEPIKNLSCDIKCTVLGHVKGEVQFEKDHSTAITEEISRVLTESNSILNSLNEEFEIDLQFVESVCKEFNIISDYSNFISLEDLQNVPNEIQELEWPEEFCVEELMQDYQELIDCYIAKFRHLETKYSTHKLSNFSLTNFELEKAKFIMNQYSDTSMVNRRKMLLDRLEKEFPKVSKFEIRDLSGWHFGLETYEFQKKLLIKSFFHSKNEFISKTKIHNQESWASHFELEEEKISKEQRKKERLEFLVKLRDWKMKRLDILRMENELATKNAEEMEEKRKMEEKIKSKETKDKKEKVVLFQQEKKSQEERKKTELEIQLDRTKKEVAKQIENDREKVNKRKQFFEEKNETRKMQNFEKNEFKLRKQELQLLITKKITDQIENDPERIHHATKASNAKFDTTQPTERDLFKLDSFPSDTITADPRIRFEMALREAGLHNTEYAKQAMQRITPIKQDKPELKSNIFQK